jgi:hypothetical protein
LVAALVFVAQRGRAPVDAFTVLHEKTYNIASAPRRILKELQIEGRPRSITHRVSRAVYP